MELTGAVALVTGAGRRIGAACAEALAGAGLRVLLHYNRSADEAALLCDRLRADGARAWTIGADLADPGAAADLIARGARLAQAPVRVLVNSAAIFEPGLLIETDQGNWERHLAINLTAPFLLMRGFARQDFFQIRPPGAAGLAGMASGAVFGALEAGKPTAGAATGHPRGKIVNLIDQRIHRPRPGHTAYTAAKTALWSVTRMAAAELAPAIQVNAIGPGPILPGPDQTPEAFAELAARVPAGRAGSPADIAEALLFFLRQDFITGEMLCVDGGEHL